MGRFARRWWGPAVWIIILAWFGETLWGLPGSASLSYLVLFLVLGVIAVGAESVALYRLQREGRDADDAWTTAVRERRSRVMSIAVAFGSLQAVAALVAILRG